MAVSLVKGQKINLSKDSGQELTRIAMGLSWDPINSFLGRLIGGGDIDLDASCLMFSENKELVDIVWFAQLQSRCGSIIHSGDNRTGAGDGDDEIIAVDLRRVPSYVKSLVFTVNSFNGQTFEKIGAASCRVIDLDVNREVAKLSLSDKGAHTGLIMLKVYRHNGAWKVHAIGEVTHGRVVIDIVKEVLNYL